MFRFDTQVPMYCKIENTIHIFVYLKCGLEKEKKQSGQITFILCKIIVVSGINGN